MPDPRYPIGKLNYSGPLTPEQRTAAIEAIENTPLELRKALRGLSGDQISTPYRDGGWTSWRTVHPPSR